MIKIIEILDQTYFPGEYMFATDSICNLNYSVSKEIQVISPNRSNHDFDLIIKFLANEFDGNDLTYIDEISKKYQSLFKFLNKNETKENLSEKLYPNI